MLNIPYKLSIDNIIIIKLAIKERLKVLKRDVLRCEDDRIKDLRKERQSLKMLKKRLNSIIVYNSLLLTTAESNTISSCLDDLGNVTQGVGEHIEIKEVKSILDQDFNND